MIEKILNLVDCLGSISEFRFCMNLNPYLVGHKHTLECSNLISLHMSTVYNKKVVFISNSFNNKDSYLCDYMLTTTVFDGVTEVGYDSIERTVGSFDLDSTVFVLADLAFPYFNDRNWFSDLYKYLKKYKCCILGFSNRPEIVIY